MDKSIRSAFVEHNELIDILPRRATDWIAVIFFAILKKRSEEGFAMFVMDMSALFRSVYKTMFPNATLIADRFHVQRLVLWAMERKKDIQNTIKFPKTSPYLKHNRGFSKGTTY